MRIYEIIVESEEDSIWPVDEIIPDPKSGGVYHILKRVNQHGVVDGFSLIYKNDQINPNSDPDDNIVINCSMNPNNNNEITWYDYSKNFNGIGIPIGRYINDDDLDKVTSKFFESVLWHITNR